ncbi:MAG: rhomboid family intramembrane serine protease [Bacteroidales bacterium]|jgi:membrane associated rhomboid family serine protease|nr:rhomboid family intramembrane serine protease [Bacteroidales bacterium]
MTNPEKIRIYRSLFYPALIVVLLWIIKAIDILFDLGLNNYGLIPLKTIGLIGIFTAPFLHANLAHLFANSVPLLILGAFLFYFYKEIAWMILGLLYLITGIWVWTFARGNGVHIGASGVIYGMASFLFFSGIIRREKSLMVITMLVAFLYGGLIWGIFPQLFPHQPISWESHLMGLLAGMVLAIYYHDWGPQRSTYEWNEESEDDDPEDAYWKKDIPPPEPPGNRISGSPEESSSEKTPDSPPEIIYHLKK